MKFIGARQLRLNPSEVWEELEEEGEIVVTTNGKPKAILTSANEENWEEALRAVRRARTQVAVSHLRRGSKKDVSSADIRKEVTVVRKKLRGRE